VAGILAIVLGLLEVALRVVPVDMPAPPVFPGDHKAAEGDTIDPDIGWKLIPHTATEDKTTDFTVTYHTNGQGFRGSKDLTPDPSRRIAFLGDSFTFGIGVADDETFPSLLAGRLELAQCCNFGISGFSIGQMWLTLRQYALPLKPTAVVLSFIFDDMQREQAYHSFGSWVRRPIFTLEGDTLVPLTEENRPGALYRFFAQNTKLYTAWLRVESALMKRYPIGATWRLNRAIFTAIRDDCRAAGVPLVVVYIPQRNLPQKLPMLSAEFERLGIDFIDLSTDLPLDRRSLYFETDRHFNAAGHRFVADGLEKKLRTTIARSPKAHAADYLMALQPGALGGSRLVHELAIATPPCPQDRTCGHEQGTGHGRSRSMSARPTTSGASGFPVGKLKG